MFFLSELMGTMTLIALGNGVVANVLLEKSKGQNSGWIVITAGWGVAVMCGIFVSFGLGGPGWLNPAVAVTALFKPDANVGAVLAGMAGELVGAFLGAVIVYLAYLPHWEETQDPELKLAVFATGPSIRKPWANCLSEVIATFILLLVIAALGSVHFTDGLVPVVIGALIWGIGLSLGGPTAYALNPARDLGPRIAHAILPLPGKGPSDWGYAWVPIAGPMIGGVAGWSFWRLISAMASSLK
jgi:glycerol uptake facilitator protein